MTSRYVTIIDAIVSDLTTNVSTLATMSSNNQLTVHKYTPQTFERLQRDGFSHLAVWLSPQAPSVLGQPAETGVHIHNHRYEIAYWEPTPEGEQLTALEDDAATILQLADDIIARFYQTSFQTVGSAAGQHRMWFESFTPIIGGGEGGVRALVFSITGRVAQDFA